MFYAILFTQKGCSACEALTHVNGVNIITQLQTLPHMFPPANPFSFIQVDVQSPLYDKYKALGEVSAPPSTAGFTTVTKQSSAVPRMAVVDSLDNPTMRLMYGGVNDIAEYVAMLSSMAASPPPS